MEITLLKLGDFANDFIARLSGEPSAKAHIVGLQGELGAGKTTFVQHVAKALEVPGHITSPTFVLAQAYPISRVPFTRLIHIDAYRLSPEEKDTLGWSEYAANPENLILVEWPERLPGGLPKGVDLLSFTVTGEEIRDIEEHHA